jgi:acyl-CoA synthetase (AMP-forming)/AMP-acid ligase II
LSLDDLKENYLNVKACFLGTAPIDLENKEKFEKIFKIPILENYGISETTFISTELYLNNSRAKSGVGILLPYLDLKFLKIEEMDYSEILVKTPFIFDGYLGKDQQLDKGLDDEGYFHSGDLGHLNSDNLLIIDGRNRDIIKKGGHIVSLKEIELLSSKNKLIDEAVCVKVPHDFYIESYIIFIKLIPGTEGIEEFGTWLRNNLVKYKWPEQIIEVQNIPKTNSGKIQKHLLINDVTAEK